MKFRINLIQIKNLTDFNDLTERMLIDAFNASHFKVFFNINDLLFNLSEKKFHKKKKLELLIMFLEIKFIIFVIKLIIIIIIIF